MVNRVFVALLILALLPLFGSVGLIVIVLSGLPIIFFQRRVGKNGKFFTIFKYRTMVRHAERLKEKYRKYNESTGPTFKIHDDPRFTRIGRFLSHTGLDELPQLVNVLRGEMALIGPRPLPVDEAKKLKPWMRKRHAILPGIMSPAILTGNYHKDFVAWMRSDVAYVKEKSLRTDARILLRLIPFCFMLLKSGLSGLRVRDGLTESQNAPILPR